MNLSFYNEMLRHVPSDKALDLAKTMHLYRCKYQKGFALPLALGIGSVLILLCITMIVRSQSDSVASVTQKTTVRGQNAAEIGVSRIQELLTTYRSIAVYPACNTWSSTDTTCSDTGTAYSWKNLPTGLTELNCPLSSTGYSTVPNFATRGWQNIDSSDASKGQYRLVDYTYSDSTGTLTVEGSVNQGDAPTTSVARLTATIPVIAPSLENNVPGLWISDGTFTKMGDDKVNGNIVANTCTFPTGGNQATTANLYDPATQSLLAINKGMPDTPSLPTSGYYDLTGSNPWQVLPRSGDAAYSNTSNAGDKRNGRYLYLVKDLVKSGNASINISSGARVDLYVQSNINLNGLAAINPSGTSAQLRIFGNTTSGTTPKYGCVSGATCPTTLASFNGTGTINAFILAPAATGNVNGGGSTNGNFKGSLWVKNWNSSSSDNTVKIDAVGKYSEYGLDNNPLGRNTFSAVTTWNRQQVN
jgi:hypothetical protein